MPPTEVPRDRAVRVAVFEIIRRSLELRGQEIRPESSLQSAYGAESLDFLDIAFAIEERFRIVLPRKTILQHAEAVFGPGAVVKDGVLTELGAEVIREMRPGRTHHPAIAGTSISTLSALVDAQSFVELVERLLAEKSALAERLRPCPKCGGEVKESDVAPDFTCGGCGTIFPQVSGDDLLRRDLDAVAARLRA